MNGLYILCVRSNVHCIGPLYGIFEIFQVTNLVFLLSRTLQKRIDFERSLINQGAAFAILIISISSFAYILYYIYILLLGNDELIALTKFQR